jgi:hypothetical protein
MPILTVQVRVLAQDGRVLSPNVVSRTYEVSPDFPASERRSDGWMYARQIEQAIEETLKALK